MRAPSLAQDNGTERDGEGREGGGPGLRRHRQSGMATGLLPFTYLDVTSLVKMARGCVKCEGRQESNGANYSVIERSFFFIILPFSSGKFRNYSRRLCSGVTALRGCDVDTAAARRRPASRHAGKQLLPPPLHVPPSLPLLHYTCARRMHAVWEWRPSGKDRLQFLHPLPPSPFE